LTAYAVMCVVKIVLEWDKGDILVMCSLGGLDEELAKILKIFVKVILNSSKIQESQFWDYVIIG